MKLISQLILPQRPLNLDTPCYVSVNWAGNGFVAFTGSQTKHISLSLAVTDAPTYQVLDSAIPGAEVIAQRWRLCVSEEGHEFYLGVSAFSAETLAFAYIGVVILSANHKVLSQRHFKWEKSGFTPLGSAITISPCGKLIGINALHGGMTLFSSNPEHEYHEELKCSSFAYNSPNIHKVISRKAAIGLGYDDNHCMTLATISLDDGEITPLICDLPEMEDASLVLHESGISPNLYGYFCASASWYLYKLQFDRQLNATGDKTIIRMGGLALDQVVAPSGTIYTLFAPQSSSCTLFADRSLTLIAHDPDLNELSRESFLVVDPFVGCPDPKIYLRSAMLCLAPEENWLGVFLYGDLSDSDDYNFNKMFLFKAVK